MQTKWHSISHAIFYLQLSLYCHVQQHHANYTPESNIIDYSLSTVTDANLHSRFHSRLVPFTHHFSLSQPKRISSIRFFSPILFSEPNCSCMHAFTFLSSKMKLCIIPLSFKTLDNITLSIRER